MKQRKGGERSVYGWKKGRWKRRKKSAEMRGAEDASSGTEGTTDVSVLFVSVAFCCFHVHSICGIDPVPDGEENKESSKFRALFVPQRDERRTEEDKWTDSYRLQMLNVFHGRWRSAFRSKRAACLLTEKEKKKIQIKFEIKNNKMNEGERCVLKSAEGAETESR